MVYHNSEDAISYRTEILKDARDGEMTNNVSRVLLSWRAASLSLHCSKQVPVSSALAEWITTSDWLKEMLGMAVVRQLLSDTMKIYADQLILD